MASNLITDRVLDFLKNYPPFNLIEPENLKRIAPVIEVKYFPANETIFTEGDAPGSHFYIVRSGSVHLQRSENDKTILVDTCDEGDVFGVRSLVTGKPFLASAFTHEESLIYAIPNETFRECMERNAKVMQYFAAGFAAGITHPNHSLSSTDEGRKNLTGRTEGSADSISLLESQKLSGRKQVVQCLPTDTIQRAAELMTEANVGSIIIVNEQRHPLGIITDTDFRKKVATGSYLVSKPVSQIMSSPVLTAADQQTAAGLLIRMMRHKVHHICITENGSTQSPVIGMLSEHDVLMSQGHNPAILIRNMRKAQSPNDLPAIRHRAEELIVRYLEQEVSIAFVAEIITEINDTLINMAIRFARQAMLDEGLHEPQVEWAWLSLGSEGRHEQLLRTDLDNGIVYADPTPDQAEYCREWFLDLGHRTNELLIQSGFSKCPSDMMASNPKWCQPLSGWKNYFTTWIVQPGESELMYTTIFFDYRRVHGSTKLSNALSEHIYQTMARKPMFLTYLARNALKNPPPLSFFRSFVVEKSGEHKNEFDLKARAMMPLVDAARVLTLGYRLTGINNTVARYKQIAEFEPTHQAVFENAAKAYEILLRFRAISGFRKGDSGRFVSPDSLNKIERQTLRNTFQAIADVQEILRVRYRLDMLS